MCFICVGNREGKRVVFLCVHGSLFLSFLVGRVAGVGTMGCVIGLLVLLELFFVISATEVIASSIKRMWSSYLRNVCTNNIAIRLYRTHTCSIC